MLIFNKGELTLKFNLILVSLFDSDIKKLSLLITSETDLYYLNVEELIDYSLPEKSKVVDICGIDYMEKQERKIVSSINQYENTLISMDYETFSRNLKNIDRNKNKIIYLQVSKNQINEKLESIKLVSEPKNRYTKKSILSSKLSKTLLVFEERDKLIKKNCDLTFKYDIFNIEKTANLIVKMIKNHNL